MFRRRCLPCRGIVASRLCEDTAIRFSLPMLWKVCLAILTLGGCGGYRSWPVPLIHAHAHNDYLHRRPLLDALDCGFCSVEADVHLVDGQLLVAHKLNEVRPELTLQSLY